MASVVLTLCVYWPFCPSRIATSSTLVRWYLVIGEDYDEDTGMWMVMPDLDNISIIHVDTIFHAAHLLPIFGPAYLPRGITYHNSLDVFATYYVNKFIDHHAFDITV